MSGSVQLVSLRPAGWRHRAACSGQGADQFLPVLDDVSVAVPSTWPCHRCPVRSACLTDAYIDVIEELPGADVIGRGGLSGPAVVAAAEHWKRTVAGPELRRRGAAARVIADELAVSVRTVQRWFAAERASIAGTARAA